VDTTITQGNILHLVFHGIGVGGVEWTVPDFQALIDYVRAKAKAGQIRVITMDDYYRLASLDVRVPRVK
jgi:hypothetical protein